MRCTVAIFKVRDSTDLTWILDYVEVCARLCNFPHKACLCKLSKKSSKSEKATHKNIIELFTVIKCCNRCFILRKINNEIGIDFRAQENLCASISE